MTSPRPAPAATPPSAARPRLPPVLLSLGLAALLAVAYVAAQRSQSWQALETRALDERLQFRGPRAAPDEVVIVALDDRTIAAYGEWPLARYLLEHAVRKLRAAGATTIGLDLLLLQRQDAVAAAEDAALAAALAEADDIVLAVARPLGAAGNADAPGPGLLVPAPVLADAARLGHVNAVIEGDGHLRRLLPAVAGGGRDYLALPIEMFRLQRGAGAAAPTAGEEALWLDFYGPAGSIATISLLDLLQDRIDPERLRGRAVLVGASATGAGDAFATVYAARLPGVEYFATALANLLEDRFLRRDEWVIAIDALCVALAALLGMAALRLLPPAAAGALLLAAAATWLAASQQALVAQGLWLSTVGPPLALLASTTGTLAGRLLRERRARSAGEFRLRNLKRYVAPALAEALAADEAPQFAGRAQQAAVLFTDIAGFTRISEAIGPKRSATLLRAFHQRIETAVSDNDGVLTSFLGDGAMAVFGLPEAREDDAVRAFATARALIDDMAAWHPVRICVGLHSGPVEIAQLGGRAQRQLTATGDTVNLASRIENLTRKHDAVLAASDSMVAAVRAAGRADLLVGLQRIGSAPIRGRRAPVDVWILPAGEACRPAA